MLPSFLEQVRYRQTRGEVAAITEALADQKIGALGKVYTMLAKSVSPSVVHIDTQQAVGPQGDDLAAMFGGRSRRAIGQGSGVVVDGEGYIVTNAHVVSGAEAVSVRLSDGRTHEATIVGTDAKNDLAVVKIDASGLIPAPWGDSDKLEVGEQVWAIGNPFGLDGTITQGIISAKGRQGVNVEELYQDYLQHDAAVNPGNSGGPLVNIVGEIVGINTAIVGPSFQGISFAIPSNLAKATYQRIRDTGGDVVNGYLGVGTLSVDEGMAFQLGLDEPRGAVVRMVAPNSPAERAGIRPGDVIVNWNGQAVHDAQELSRMIAGSEAGSEAKVGIIRNGKPVTLDATLGRRPASRRSQR